MVKGVAPDRVGRAVGEVIKEGLSKKGAGRRTATTATTGDCLQAEENMA